MIKANWLTWSNIIRTIIVLALLWLMIDKFTHSTESPDLTKYIEQFNELQGEINEQGEVIDSLDKAFSALDTTLILRYETIDTTNTTNGLRDITGSILARSRR